MDFNVFQIILVLIVAFLAGLEGILDEFQFHQPIIACTLVGLATGHLTEGIILGGSLQIIALAWANVGAAVAPDAALASVASAIIFIKGNDFSEGGRNLAIATAVTLGTVGLVLTMVVRTLSVALVHRADAAAEKGDFKGVSFWHYVALCCQGLRIMIPAGLLLFLPSDVVQGYLKSIPDWFANGMTIGGNMVVAVGLAMVINLMASKETWPFFFIGFAIAPLNELTLIATGVIALSLALIYLNLSNNSGNGSTGGRSGSGDPLGDILNDY
ncbi:PTS mannose/fructose/sorbose transporter subunit IIC [Granulicatella adiacens ATCC 49175]|jgi:mannose permease IIC component|uniref:PTS system sorbose-specific iic component n=1 Tax=Granulicatella adiacens ATCC 49175 TaxID=638301 RepID=C8NEI0_9LACT|nr:MULTISPECIES: PTS mannose/fructose/sorbose transporter subunit IIC [Granulicatella]RKW27907.1 MAG: PTS mannose/fructose/sorbose transporter subunit IIC [Granulicatella sp.]EEW38081.1 PTS system sorbose-specific iic component [Granulicatella adiacens ATCC 49175]MCT2160802.1 PTS mannose/fructose/sorbose transporter subunit IIC [Granulicatella adiacens]OFT81804.1 PTS mannose/fructose/sorbose transporter subunit IIC [Granulicatella sp. HMSC30F09]UAK93793.1 PTS mannose/fructose/sorbose transport